MQVIKKLALWGALVVLATSAWAQVAQQRGKATLTYQGPAATADDKNRATVQAQLKAIETYYAEAGQSEQDNFDAVRDKIAGSLDRYVLESTVLAEQDEPSRKQYTVAVRVSLNVASLRNAIKASSAVAQGGPAPQSPLAFMFVSRQVDSTRAFDDRVYKRVDESVDAKGSSTSAKKGNEGEAIGKNQISTNESTSKQASASLQRTSTVETGGSVTRKASESTYRLIPSANLAQVFTSTFTRAGFKVREAAMVEPYTEGKFKVALVEDDYKSGNDLKPATLNSLVQGMRVVQIPYVALGTLDVGMVDKDPATGLARVSVTVNAKLLDISQPIPDTLASVGPVQYSGTGPSEEEARGSALRLAANNAARELTSQLTSLRVR